MIQLSASSEIVVAISPQDFRKGIDGFVSVCRHEFSRNPKTGAYSGEYEHLFRFNLNAYSGLT